MRVREPDLLHSHRTSCAGHLGSRCAEKTQYMAHNLVPRPQLQCKEPPSAGSGTDVTTTTVLL